MGKGHRDQKHKHKQNKSNQQKQIYRSHLNLITSDLDDTAGIFGELLYGSDDLSYDYSLKPNANEEYKRLPVHKRVKRFIENNLIASIIGGVLVAILTGIVSILIRNTISIAKLEVRIESIQQMLSEKADSTTVMKDLEILKLDLNNSFILEYNELAKRIDEIEREMMILQLNE